MSVSDPSWIVPIGESNGVAGLGQLPAFELPAADGRLVRSWDYRGRRLLVLWLAGARPEARALADAVAYQTEFRAEGAELLVLVQETPAAAARRRAETGSTLTILADADGRVHARLGAERPALLVTDRNGKIYWRAAVEAGQPDFAEALSWLRYLGILEPECGTCVPAWPVE